MPVNEINKLYNLETYNYSLPKELISQYPSEKRDESRLLCYKKSTGEVSHHIFYDIVDLITANDVLVLNNTKVIPARFYAHTEDQNKKIEILLVSSVSPDGLTWKILAKPRKHLNNSKVLNVIARSDSDEAISLRKQIATSAHSVPPRNDVKIEIIDNETVRFKSHEDLKIILHQVGQMPLPPYIKRQTEDMDTNRYQTVFAKNSGAVAAPTAALHFTKELLKKVKEKGAEVLELTLHVGPGTFLPVRTDDIREHKIIPESYFIEPEIWGKIKNAKKDGKRIIACGTTTIRTLEYIARVDKLSGITSLFIMPGFEFKIVDALITNFHLPKTTLLMLVSSFIGWENMKTIYDEAIKEKYRFFSYGDSMIVL